MNADSSRPPFPSYLLPSISFPTFRRRQASSAETSPPSLSSSTNTTPSSSPTHSTNLLAHHFNSIRDRLQSHVENTPEPATSHLARTQPATMKCVTCASDIAFTSQIVSKGFTGRHGRAYLVAAPETTPGYEADTLLNTKVGKSVSRQLLTGAHVVGDVSCLICQTVLGWKYVDAKEAQQHYKIGKFILETKRVVACTSWEDNLPGKVAEGEEEREEEQVQDDDDVVVFDSEDEDECEDLFAGVWDAKIVAKRRGRRLPARK
ncbi:Protein yippee-like protein [Phlyctema vagabunda]|uniref:Protein yippee-like protein n=1 Tax=Phlyctema vagabunda TaxID=108571 RepID=A0ABR4PML7_9HELO